MASTGDRQLRNRKAKKGAAAPEPLPANSVPSSSDVRVAALQCPPQKMTFWQFVRRSMRFVAIFAVFFGLWQQLTPVWDPRATVRCTLPADGKINWVRNQFSVLCQLYGTSEWALCKGSFDLSRYPTAPFLPPYVTNLPAKQSYASRSLRRVLLELIETNIVSAFYGRVTLGQTESVNFEQPAEYEKLFESHTLQVTPRTPLTFSVGKPMDNIEDDRLWAHHFVGGIHPMVITRVRDMDAALAAMGATDEKRTVLLRELERQTGLTADTAFGGRVFLADYGEVSDITSFVEGRVVHSPAVLFFQTPRAAESDLEVDDTPSGGGDGRVFELRPLAVQITSGTSKAPQYKQHLLLSPTLFADFDDHCEFSPDEHRRMWNFAKLCVMTADSHVHEFVSHLGETHLAMEPVAATFFTHFPEDHPFRRLFQEHFYGTLAINNLGRSTLLSPGGMFDDVASSGYKGALELMNAHFERQWRYMQEASFPRRMRKRFFHDLVDEDIPEHEKDVKTIALLKTLLPFEEDVDYTKAGLETSALPWDFAYAQDGAELWTTFKTYVDVLVSQTFKELVSCDQYTGEGEEIPEATVDPALREFVRDLRRMKIYEDAFPGDRVCREATTAFFTTTLWVASAQHSAVNFGQYDMYAFPPIRALMQQLPFPLANTEGGTCPSASAANEKLYVQALASLRQSITTMQAATSLSIMVAKPLTEELERIVWRQEGKSPIDHARFVALENIRALERKQTLRNQHLHDAGFFAYPWLMPDNMAVSIDI